VASEEVTLYLVKSKCIPIFLYGLEVCELSKSQMASQDFTINRFLEYIGNRGIKLWTKSVQNRSTSLGQKCKKNRKSLTDVFMPQRYSLGDSILQLAWIFSISNVKTVTGAKISCFALLVEPRRKAGQLHDGDVLLSVCLSVCLFVRSSVANAY